MSREYPQNDPLTERIASMRVFSRAVQAALVTLSVVVCVSLFAVAWTDMHRALEIQAESYAELVLAARAWNAGHGGVYVLKTPTVTTNQYLSDLGIDPDIRTDDGTELTMRNPAVMTREISERLARSQGVRFRLASTEPINPRNESDPWERQAIERFETDNTPATVVGEVDGTTYFRYIAPMITDESCLVCHAQQGYRVGDVRGGLEVFVPYEPTRSALSRDAWLLVLVGFASSAVLVGVFSALFGRFQRGLEEAGSRLTRVATLDYLTGVPNRRTGLQRLNVEIDRSRRAEEPLSVIAVDIDHFKRINDDAGHAAGDDVLRGVAARMSDTMRDYDTLARMGGEEFLVIAPATDPVEAVKLAERLLDAVRSELVSAKDLRYHVTISAGVATLKDGDTTDSLLDRADSALYAAKDAGRDRVLSQ